MLSESIDRVTVLGAGSMGHGIAEVAAIAGYQVVLRDIEQEFVRDGYEEIEWSLGKLEKKGRLDEDAEAVLGRVSTAIDLEESVADADLVVEAIPEQMALKRETFATIDEAAPDRAILATNTSSLSITEIASATERPERVVGTHFFNPPVKMDLVEVIEGEVTSDETVDAAFDFVEALEKTPIHVRKDVHGFVVNNVLLPFMEEPARMLAADETTVRKADAAMVYERGYPMGPFELLDYTGIDIAYHFREEAGQKPPDPIAERVERDDLGTKSGAGFYQYEDGDGATYEPDDGEGFDTLRVEALMVNEAAKLLGNDVTTPEEIDIGMRLGAGLPEGTCLTGDKLGLDTVLDKLRTLHDETGESRFVPADYLVELVESGKTGADAGEGFYQHGEGSPFHYVSYDLSEDGVLTVTLDRAERLNAFCPEMFEEVDRLLSREIDGDDVVCVVFEGAGDRAFSAGADITGFTTSSPTEMMDVDDVFRTVYRYDRPTIAKIDGFCLGAGFELALACDLRVATDSARFASPEIDLGLIPGGGATQRLVRLVGETRTKELLFTGDQIDAERARDWGIVNRVVPEDELNSAVDEFVQNFVGGPTTALKIAKQVVHEGQDASLDTALALESKSFGLLTSTDDMLEGVTAFRQGRDPEFGGGDDA
ncbi:3-hydroxyacyl-CoA dehydrogenase NAD-binding domain-containing protein [Haladaptatus sp. AB618]|uniref:3-hydroxyacyl-CoA dehydrogenase/enoyl-CoA hydratase family protein n=1 Tax=Haladaptatus sp. AB618 TaxID=2934173 RepID=UPI00209BDE86|nr:3-hydroxyacyl-CoA dehydrogenase NAD-binding domain-containing protein [Haladaptatus sp. AB618]MCO8256691.1 3-hydroxyacyl-CoA dehydrogenase NAD-binding domain-containing protein [Haladaptatus sp. AB618]